MAEAGAIVLAAMLAVFVACARPHSHPHFLVVAGLRGAGGQSAAHERGDDETEGRGGRPPRPAQRPRDGQRRQHHVAAEPGNKSRLQVDLGGSGSAEFTFKRSAFNRIVVRGTSGADMRQL